MILFLLLIEGPNLPKRLQGHSSVTQGSDLIVISGEDGDGIFSSNLYKLSLKNKKFEWSEMNVQLKTPRSQFVTSLIPV